MTAANKESSAFKDVFVLQVSKEEHMMFCWEQRTKLYKIKIFQMYANKTDLLLGCIAEPDEELQTSCHELLHKNLRASFSHYCITRLTSHN